MFCKKCNQEKDITLFSKDSSQKSGYKSVCSECRNKNRRSKWAENPEIGRAKLNAYYHKNREKINQHRKDLYQENLEENREKQREYNREHSERRNALLRQYREEHPERFAEYNKRNRERHSELYQYDYLKKKPWYREMSKRNSKKYRESVFGKLQRRKFEHRRRVRKQQNGGSIGDYAGWLREIKDAGYFTCAYCNREFLVYDTEGKTNLHIDHILPISRGGSDTRDNVCAACPECNLSKGMKTVSEWFEKIGFMQPQLFD